MMATSSPVPRSRSSPDLEPAADLQGAEPQGGGGAEEGREDGEDVDDPADRAVGVPSPISGTNTALIVLAARRKVL